MTLMQGSCLISLLFITHISEYPPECALGKVMPDRSPTPLLIYSFLVFSLVYSGRVLCDVASDDWRPILPGEKLSIWPSSEWSCRS